jgi:hypothetical protein
MSRANMATTVSLAWTGTSLVWAVASQAAADPDPNIGTSITITGCLHGGTPRDTFVLLA